MVQHVAAGVKPRLCARRSALDASACFLRLAAASGVPAVHLNLRATSKGRLVGLPCFTMFYQKQIGNFAGITKHEIVWG